MHAVKIFLLCFFSQAIYASSFPQKTFRLVNYSFQCVRLLLNEWLFSTEKCWNENNYTHYDQGYPQIRFMRHAPSVCKSPEYPIISIYDHDATHWIQIVAINVLPPKNGHSLQNDKWIFFDTSEEFHKNQIPFYNTVTPYKVFWDNPSWGCFLNPFKNKDLNWHAITFSVSVKDNIITPRYAFSWGYRIDYQKVLIDTVEPERIDLGIWENFRTAFTTQYPKWVFQKYKKTNE